MPATQYSATRPMYAPERWAPGVSYPASYGDQELCHRLGCAPSDWPQASAALSLTGISTKVAHRRCIDGLWHMHDWTNEPLALQ